MSKNEKTSITKKFTKFFVDILYIDDNNINNSENEVVKRTIRHDEYNDFVCANNFFNKLKSSNISDNAEVQFVATGKTGRSNISCLLANFTTKKHEEREEYVQFLEETQSQEYKYYSLSPEKIKFIIDVSNIATMIAMLNKELEQYSTKYLPEDLRDKFIEFRSSVWEYKRSLYNWLDVNTKEFNFD